MYFCSFKIMFSRRHKSFTILRGKALYILQIYDDIYPESCYSTPFSLIYNTNVSQKYWAFLENKMTYEGKTIYVNKQGILLSNFI